MFKKSAFTALAFLSLAACSSGPSYDYFQVNSRFLAAAQDQQSPEITTSPAHAQVIGKPLTVAVRAPDRCSNATTTQATGEAAGAGAILQTNCGVEMGEIERALTRAGYNVISWNILQREMARNTSATEVASTLGAQVLFQINSLENSRKTLGQDARWERSYFRTDAQGKTAVPLPLTEQARNTLSSTYLAPIEAQANVRALAVSLDANAVWVSTGQTIWYYRWTKAAEPTGVSAGYRLRLACMQGYGFSQCQPTRAPAEQGPAGTVVSAGESVAISASERPEDVERAIYSELFREVVANFVESFSTGRT